MTEIYRNIAWKLINLRQREGLTQEQLSEKISLSKCQISRAERGQGQITLESLFILSTYFEVPLEDLFSRTSKMDIEMKLRTEYVERKLNTPCINIGDNLAIKNYVKAFENTAKIRSIEIASKSIRKMKVEKNFRYEIYVLQGSFIARTNDETFEIKKDQLLSVKGTGTLKLVNMHSERTTVLTIAY
ncbi:MAG TPA: helix-turn-helix transcriptional regulator [Pseudobdellovibrionaceae bacterium]|jgi:transcriptional regulator with XRE-family HTH domain